MTAQLIRRDRKSAQHSGFAIALSSIPVLPPAPLAVQQEVAVGLGIPWHSLSGIEQRRLSENTLSANLGAVWIPPYIYVEFAAECLKWRDRPDLCAQISYVKHPVAEWIVTISDQAQGIHFTDIYGHGKNNFGVLLEKGLNLKEPTVTKGGQVDEIATEQCRQKLNRIKDEFSEWLWADIDRAIELTRLYNECFNWCSPRESDGSHLQFEGMSNDIHLNPHQKNAVQFNFSQFGSGRGSLLAHDVGAGKTYSGIATAMEGIQLGLVQKALIAVKAANLSHWGEAWLRLYPDANILVGDDATLRRYKGFQGFLFEAKKGNYDAVIITHDRLPQINHSPKVLSQHFDEPVEEIRQDLEQIKDRATHSILESQHQSAIEKLLTRKLAAQEKKAQKGKSEWLKKRKARCANWDDLGFDLLIYDESQKIKNLGYGSKINAYGVSTRSSAIAEDALIKTRQLLDNGGNVIFMTGTPLTNSLAEMFTLMTFLCPNELEQMGIAGFDEWASVFAQAVTAPEILPTGYRMQTRLRLFQNVPELFDLYRGLFADVQTQQTLKLPKPEVKEITVSVPPTPLQQDYMQHLVQRADRIHAKAVRNTEDNMLVVGTDGKLVSLDPRTVVPDAPEEFATKVNICALNVHHIWQMADKYGIPAVQLVFCDDSTPNEGMWTAYQQIKDLLAGLVHDADAVAFIHDATSDKQRHELFERCRKGEVRCIVGSTDKLGTGVNIQDWALVGHNLDAPWTPAALEQRNGRPCRQGNNFDKVFLLYYLTEGAAASPGFDAFRWQHLWYKKRCFDEMQSGGTARTIEDLGSENALSYAQVKAIATGDPTFLKLAELEQQIQQLEIEQRNYIEQAFSVRSKLRQLRNRIDGTKLAIADYQADLEQAQEFSVSPKGATTSFSPLAAKKWFMSCLPNAEFAACGFKAIRNESTLTLYGNREYQLRWYADTGRIVENLQNLKGHIKAELQKVQQQLEADLQDLAALGGAELPEEWGKELELERLRDVKASLEQQVLEAKAEQQQQRQSQKLDSRLQILAKSKCAPYTPPSAELIQWLHGQERLEWMEEVEEYLSEYATLNLM